VGFFGGLGGVPINGGMTAFQSFIVADLMRWGEYPMVCELGVGEGWGYEQYPS
jgi:hypothetical protein